MKRTAVLARVGLAVLGVVSCFGPAAGQTTQGEQARAVEKRCLQFARMVERAVARRDSGPLDRALDMEVIAKRATAGIDAPEGVRNGFLRGLKKGLGGFGHAIVAASGEDDRYAFVRLHWKDGRPFALFRLSGNGINYHDMELRVEGESVRIDDVFIALLGETFSQTVRQMYLKVVELTGGSASLPAEDLRKIAAIKQILDREKAGETARALQMCKDIPAEWRKDKVFAVTRVRLAQLAGEPEYSRAMEAVEKDCAGQTWAELLLVDHYLGQKQFAKALAAVDKIDQAVGGDLYLNGLRASLAARQGDYEKAIRLAKAAGDAESVVEGLWVVTNVSLEKRDHAMTVRLLTILERDHGVLIGDLETAEDYREFVKSPEYRQWTKAREARNL